VRGQRDAPVALYPRERPGTHCTGGWVGPRAGLARCGNSRLPPGFDPRTVQLVASRYTDYATRPTLTMNKGNKLCPQGRRNRAELHSSGLNGSASLPDKHKSRMIGFFFEKRLHWQFEVRLSLFAVCTAVWTFPQRPI